MYIINLIFVFIFGLIIGSFLNVCIYRIPREESIAFPPSHCTSCNSRLKPKDLVPILSYIFLKGKCRYCGEKIKNTYVIIEFITAVIFVMIYIKYDLGVYFFIYSFLASLLMVMSKIDLDTLEVYFDISVVGFVGGAFTFVYNLYKGEKFLNLGLSVLVPLILIGVLILVTKGMGTGDLEVYLVVAMYFPIKIMALILFLSIVIGGIHGLIKLVLGKVQRKSKLAFIPYIGIATVIAMLWGQPIVNSYLNLICF